MPGETPCGTFCSHANILGGKQWERKAVCPMGSAILPPHTTSNHRLCSSPHQHTGAPAFILQAPSPSAGCSLKVPSLAKQLLSVTAPSGRSRGEGVFEPAGVTAIACYRPHALLSRQELSGPAITQRRSCPGEVAANNGGFMDFGGDFVSGNLRGFAGGKRWRLAVLIKGGEAMPSAKVGVRSPALPPRPCAIAVGGSSGSRWGLESSEGTEPPQCRGPRSHARW